jgi:hypothetical protein
MFNDLGEEIVTSLIVIILAAFFLGVGCTKGCDYVQAHYSIEVKKTP